MSKVLRVYNTLSGRKEVFRSTTPGAVKMFVCGPTVQSSMHLGHARTYIFYDVVARYLTWLGYSVDFLMNITDIDERITSAANEADTDSFTLARRFSRSFLEDMARLRIKSVGRYEPVSEHVGEMIRQVSTLVKRRRAYAVDGWVYFDTKTFPAFGRLSHLSKAELSLRPLELSLRKRNLLDFALWRPEALVEGKWRSPWGRGSPGWHIQDTAITLSMLGPTYDIHGGAYELVYPHHEAEIAQAETITSKRPLVKYWIHTHLVQMKGEKMSKSLGNVVTVRDALRYYSPDELRFFFLSTHYRRDMDLSGLGTSARRLRALRRAIMRLATSSARAPHEAAPPAGFTYAMNDDFDTPRAIAHVESAVTSATSETSPRKREEVKAAAVTAMSILGVDAVG